MKIIKLNEVNFGKEVFVNVAHIVYMCEEGNWKTHHQSTIQVTKILLTNNSVLYVKESVKNIGEMLFNL